jgi:hypothetical protein
VNDAGGDVFRHSRSVREGLGGGNLRREKVATGWKRVAYSDADGRQA